MNVTLNVTRHVQQCEVSPWLSTEVLTQEEEESSFAGSTSDTMLTTGGLQHRHPLGVAKMHAVPAPECRVVSREVLTHRLVGDPQV